MSENLVIVESPAKAKTIEKYLGKNFRVMASIGHIRKDTKVDRETFAVTYEIDPDHRNVIEALKKASASADKIWLATDEDREGEAISWHLAEVLGLPADTARITFHEITESALQDAINHPRTVDMDMVASQQTRQTLDLLVGFDLSSAVRKKVPGAVSAGRVQSPALRLVVEREREIENFHAESTFKVAGDFGFDAKLNRDFPDQASAKAFLESLKDAHFTVSAVETAPATRSPLPPFTTATMQIDANSRLGFSARTTMNAAQSLYQAGLITYHRTDSLSLSRQATARMADYIKRTFGAQYSQTRNFHTNSIGAQEAHEAIRPTDIDRETAGKNAFEQKLYTLIRNRALASQMAPAKIERTTIAIAVPGQSNLRFEGKGEVVLFDGFLKIYGRFRTNELPHYAVGDAVSAKTITARETFAKAPARYTEGSLVKKLEELGIGRPSTYAGIMSAIQSRNYVVKGESDGRERTVTLLSLNFDDTPTNAKNGAEPTGAPTVVVSTEREKFGGDKDKLIPTQIGELVAGFLTDYFQTIVDYRFTANVEHGLDLIAEHKLDRLKMLHAFYEPFTASLAAAGNAERYNNAHLLGNDPQTGKAIYAKTGKNGGFIQLGDNEKESGEKPRFVSLPKGANVKTVTLAQALAQLALPTLPRSLGHAPDGTEIIASDGPFGPYLKCGKYNVPIKDYDPHTITLADALPLYDKKRHSYIADWGDIQIIVGAYGPYVKGVGRRNNARIPAGTDPKTVTEEQARALLAKKPQSGRKAKGKAGRAKTKADRAKAKTGQRKTAGTSQAKAKTGRRTTAGTSQAKTKKTATKATTRSAAKSVTSSTSKRKSTAKSA